MFKYKKQLKIAEDKLKSVIDNENQTDYIIGLLMGIKDDKDIFDKAVHTIKGLEKQVLDLSQQLKDARSMKELLEKMTNKTLTASDGITISGGSMWSDISLSLGDNVPVYVDDMLGGKVIKQEATKVIEIDESGNVKYGLTKQKPDRGYQYKLIRK